LPFNNCVATADVHMKYTYTLWSEYGGLWYTYMRNVHVFLALKCSLGRSRRASGSIIEFYIKWILREIGWDGGDWIDLAQDRDQWRALVKAVMNLGVP
jgi:hypothetical protein